MYAYLECESMLYPLADHSDTNLTSLRSIQPCCNYSSFTHIFLTARYTFIQLSELGHRRDSDNAQASKRHHMGFESGLSRLRVRHSTAELLRPIIVKVTKNSNTCII